MLTGVQMLPKGSIDRQSPIKLAFQISDALSRFIAEGILKGGDVLPSTRELRDLFGVSHGVATEALRHLAAEKKITLRTKSCAVVNAARQNEKNGVILLVFPGGARYFPNVFVQERLVAALHSSGYVARPVLIERYNQSGTYDLTRLRAELLTRNELAVCYNASEDILRMIEEAGQPYLNVFSVPTGSPLCVGTVTFDRLPALTAFAQHCAKRRVGRVTLACKYPHECDVLAALLAQQGVKTQTWPIRVPLQFPRGEVIEKTFFQAFERRFGRARCQTLPELLYFSDDFACYGALAALQTHRVSVPKDVRIVTVTNRGLNRPFPFSLTRLEYDYAHYGDRISRLVVDYLRTGVFESGVSLGPAYQKGDSFR